MVTRLPVQWHQIVEQSPSRDLGDHWLGTFQVYHRDIFVVPGIP